MEKTDDRPAENFSLAKSNVQHYLESLAKVSDRKGRFGKLEKADNPVNGIEKSTNGYQQDNCKNNLFGHN
jgi:hypothetical protein